MSAITQNAFGAGYRLGAPGDIADSGPYNQISGAAAEAMPNGGAFVVETAVEDVFRLIKQNQLTTLFSGDTTAGPVTVTLRTTALDGTTQDTAVSTAFLTDHATTMANLIADISAVPGLTAILTDAAGAKRSVQITARDDKSVSIAVGFAHAALTFTNTFGSADIPAGITRLDRTQEKNTDGLTDLKAGDTIGVVREGRVFVYAEEAITKSSVLYSRFSSGSAAGQNRGNLRASAGGPVVAAAIGGNISVHQSAAAGAVAVIELGLMGS